MIWLNGTDSSKRHAMWRPARPLARRSSVLLAGAAAMALAASMTGCGGGEGRAGSTVTVTASTASTTTAGQTGAPTSTPAGASTARTAQAQSTGATGAVAAGNAICARRDAEVGALNAAVTSGARSKVASGISRRAAVERRALGELDRLAPPAAVASDWRKVLEYGDVKLRRTIALGERARSHHVSAMQSLSLIVTATPLPVLAAAAHSGLKQCYLRGAPALK